jgi:hypothetical protein
LTDRRGGSSLKGSVKSWSADPLTSGSPDSRDRLSHTIVPHISCAPQPQGTSERSTTGSADMRRHASDLICKRLSHDVIGEKYVRTIFATEGQRKIKTESKGIVADVRPTDLPVDDARNRSSQTSVSVH